MLEETEAAIKKTQFRNAGNNGYATHRTTTNKTQSTKRMSNTDLTKNRR